MICYEPNGTTPVAVHLLPDNSCGILSDWLPSCLTKTISPVVKLPLESLHHTDRKGGGDRHGTVIDRNLMLYLLFVFRGHL